MYDNDPSAQNPEVYTVYSYLDYNDFSLSDCKVLLSKKEDTALDDLLPYYITGYTHYAHYSERTIKQKQSPFAKLDPKSFNIIYETGSGAQTYELDLGDFTNCLGNTFSVQFLDYKELVPAGTYASFA